MFYKINKYINIRMIMLMLVIVIFILGYITDCRISNLDYTVCVVVIAVCSMMENILITTLENEKRTLITDRQKLLNVAIEHKGLVCGLQRNCKKLIIVNNDAIEINNKLINLLKAKEQPQTNMNHLVTSIHENAVKHGWWDDERSIVEIVALCHAELSEAVEEVRDGKPMMYVVGDNGEIITDVKKFDGRKPEGIATELADCVIRIMDYFGKENLDLDQVIRIKHEYNKGRAYKHGGKVL